MRPVPKCVLDRSRPCNSCVAADPRSCPYPYLLGESDLGEPDEEAETETGTAAPEGVAAAPAR
ncbi:hypothetical protein KBZ10_11710 [Streptomyces sp. F63]|uniref:hypothetical protein n=1 Tax=Streptomyces sp. F63 TaxID=2824887 RepID=UPI001B36AB35|nr:hypothetical protein [Streptomyces sp. F63]MBQ0985174.1 hypothetical protein [Streptomyces sp. F63]